jgi:methyl-accepting chemotaxis protein
VRWRSTTLAETFFTEQALVDTPLKTEFHKHLPGILTGLGIIGTFSGLITGLIRFEVSGDAERIRASLNGLIQSVGYSFAVSAMAITLAMVFIWVEKSLLSACYRRVEGLCRVIDSLFDAGAGEEYLARLVASSENSAARIEEIKNSLAGELKQVLTGVLTQHAKTSAMLNRQLLSGIGESIRPHVETIARAVEHRDATPAEAIASSVNQVLDSFTARMQDIVGSQFHEMAGVLKDTSRTMESAALQVGRCVELMQTAGRGTEEAMARRMDLAITSLDERQRIMDRSMGEFVAQTSRVAGSQTDAVRDVQSMLADLGERMTLMVDRIEAGSRLAAETTREGTEHLALMTRESSELFHAGRDALQRSFADFTEASGTMGATLQAIQKASGGLQGASSNLATATHGVKDMLEEHRRTSEIFAAIVAELRATIENARHEASMTTEIVERIRQATGQLGLAQNKAGEYLHALTEVLAQAHAEFAGNIEQTLRRSNTQFHEELSRAVSLVSGAIQDFGDVLDAVSTKEEKRCWV